MICDDKPCLEPCVASCGSLLLLLKDTHRHPGISPVHLSIPPLALTHRTALTNRLQYKPKYVCRWAAQDQQLLPASMSVLVERGCRCAVATSPFHRPNVDLRNI